jgi:lipopolysaccharide export system permease protein
VLIFENTCSGTSQGTIAAERGRLGSARGGEALALDLSGGEVHRISSSRDGARMVERYEHLSFERHRFTLDLSDLAFERRERDGTYRSTRTMRTSELVMLADSLGNQAAQRRQNLRRALHRLAPEGVSSPLVPVQLSPEVAEAMALPAAFRVMEPPSPAGEASAYDRAVQHARVARGEVDAAVNTLRWEQRRIDGYRIEIYKKYAIAVACVVFMLIGIPLGLSVGRVGLAPVGVAAACIFLFYWVMLVQGEKLADRGFMDPWIGMWAANAIVGTAAVVFFLREARDPALRDLRHRLFRRQARPT